MQRNAVILARQRMRKQKSSEEDYQDDIGETLAEALERGNKEQKLFGHFWLGIRRRILSYESKSKEEKQSMKLQHTAKRTKIKISNGVFNPDKISSIIWDLLLSCLVIYSIIMIPYNIGMNLTPTKSENAIDWFITALFAIDIFINFNTAYLDSQSERLVFDRSLIATHYVRFWFWVDFVATIPFDSIVVLFSTSQNLHAFRIIRILRLVRLFKIVKIFNEGEYLEKLHINPQIASLFVIIVVVFYIAHIYACFWHYITLPSAFGVWPETWVSKFGFSDASNSALYVAALYYIIITMSTVGYGDISATNQLERLYAIIVMLTGGFVFGALVSKLTELIDNHNPQAKALKEKMDELKAFLTATKLPKPVQMRAKAAYNYYFSAKSAFPEETIYADLPEAIMKQLIYELYGDDITKIQFLKAIESAFVVDMVKNFKPYQAFPNEEIYCEGDVMNDVCFVKNGTVRIVINDGNKAIVVGCVTQGDFFGDAEYLKNTTSFATYSAVTRTNLLSVSNSVLSRAISEHHQTGEKFNALIKIRYENLKEVMRNKSQPSSKDREIASFSPKKRLHRGFSSIYSRFEKEPTDASSESSPPKRKPLKRSSTISTRGGPIKSKSIVFSMLDLSVIDDVSESEEEDEVAKIIWIDGEKREFNASLSSINLTPDANYKKKKLVRILMTDALGIDTVIEKDPSFLRQENLLNPFGKNKIKWDFFIGVLIIYSVLVVPVQIAFSSDAYADLGAVDIVVNCFFFIDIVLSFITCVQSPENEALIIDRREIVTAYLQSWFSIDVVSTVPFDTIIEAATTGGSSNLQLTKLVKIIRLIRLLKMFRILKLGKYVAKIEDVLGMSPAVFALISLLVQVFFIAHWICCLWWGLTTIVSQDRWYNNFGPDGYFPLNLASGTTAARYEVSLYYVITTLTTVGYGDIHPINTSERGIASVIALCGASLFGYMIANVSGLIGQVSGTDSASKEKVGIVVQYLNEKHCPRSLRLQIVNHFKRQEKEQHHFDVSTIVSRLPPRISTEILMQLYDKRMSQIAIFKYISNNSVRVYLFQRLSSSFFEASSYIFKQRDMSREISFIVSGDAVVFKRFEALRSDNLLRKIHSKDKRNVLSEKIVEQSLNSTRDDEDPHVAVFLSEDSRDNQSQEASPRSLQQSSVHSIFSTPPSHFFSSLTGRSTNSSRDSSKDNIQSLINDSESNGSNSKLNSKLKFTSPLSKRAPRESVAGGRGVGRGLSTQRRQHVEAPSVDDVGSDSHKLRDRFLPARSSVSFIVRGDKYADHDELNELAKTLKKPLYSLNADHYKSVGLKYLGKVRTGDFVGHQAFFHSGAHEVSVKAVSPLAAYSLNKLDLVNLIRTQPTLGIQLQSALAQAVIAQSQSLGKYHLRSQRARFLKDLKHGFYKRNNFTRLKRPSVSEIKKPLDSGKLDPALSDSGRSRSSTETRIDTNLATTSFDASEEGVSKRPQSFKQSASRRQSMIGNAAHLLVDAQERAARINRVETVFNDASLWYDSEKEEYEPEQPAKERRSKRLLALLFSPRNATEKQAAQERRRRSSSLSEIEVLKSQLEMEKIIPTPVAARIKSMFSFYADDDVTDGNKKENKDDEAAEQVMTAYQANYLIDEETIKVKEKFVRRQSWPANENKLWRMCDIYEAIA